MTDTLSKEKRSELMSKVRSRDTGPELLVRKYLFSKGFRYRIHDSRYPGTPDIVLPRYKTMIFVHGCLWHGHEKCSLGRLPKSRINYWKPKIEANKERDRAVREKLEAEGWQILTVWNCQLRTKKAAAIALPGLVEQIRKMGKEVMQS